MLVRHMESVPVSATVQNWIQCCVITRDAVITLFQVSGSVCCKLYISFIPRSFHTLSNSFTVHYYYYIQVSSSSITYIT